MNFDGIVLKVASRCNLNCSYCFMYNLGDETYKGQPKFMSMEVVDAVLEKTEKFMLQNGLKDFLFIFHGGEPLLIDKEFYRSFIDKAKVIEARSGIQFKYDMQTNGVLITKEWSKLFKELNIIASVSIDGTKKAHDMYRVDHKGKGSYDRVVEGAKILKQETGEVGLICVINIKEEPKNIYNSFKKINVDNVNFLLSDYTHDSWPYAYGETPTADWLIDLFNIWIKDQNPIRIPLLHGFFKRVVSSDRYTRNESTALVIETNGEIETIDSLKACGDGFTKSGMNVKRNDLADIVNSSLGKLYFEDSTTKLPNQCLECPILRVCQGGRLVHRYSKSNGFDNPSVYCHDIIKFTAYIQNYLMKTYPEVYAKEGIDQMDANEIIAYLESIKDETSVYSEELAVF